MTPQQRRELLGDDVIEHCHRIAAEAPAWPPELAARLAALLHQDIADTAAA